MTKWYRMQVQDEDPSVADIYIFDFIGDWIDDLWGFDDIVTTAKSFINDLEKLPDSVKTERVHVNSPGGDVFGAIAIANALRDQRTKQGRQVETIVEGLAASAASIVIQAGDPIRIGDNALVMIHNPWTIAIGEAKELIKAADDLDTIRNTIIATYHWHSDLKAKEIGALMDETTWMEADEAIEKGFATEKVEGLKAAASLDRRGIAKLSVPEKYRDRVGALIKVEDKSDPQPAEATEVLRLCREANCLDLAEVLIKAQTPIEDVRARVAQERETRERATARAAEIRALCDKAKLPELADGYINGEMSLDDIRAHLTTLTAKLDQLEIDGSLDPDHGTRQKPKINVSEVYATRNRLQLGAGEKE
jgi:ATP-dependent protease ClpP protease subunit